MTENQKKIFSLVTAGVLTLIIVGVWFSWGDNSADDNNQVSTGKNKLSSISPWQVIKDEFSKVFSDTNEVTSSTTENLNIATTTVETGEATSTEI